MIHNKFVHILSLIFSGLSKIVLSYQNCKIASKIAKSKYFFPIFKCILLTNTFSFQHYIACQGKFGCSKVIRGGGGGGGELPPPFIL